MTPDEQWIEFWDNIDTRASVIIRVDINDENFCTLSNVSSDLDITNILEIHTAINRSYDMTLQLQVVPIHLLDKLPAFSEVFLTNDLRITNENDWVIIEERFYTNEIIHRYFITKAISVSLETITFRYKYYEQLNETYFSENDNIKYRFKICDCDRYTLQQIFDSVPRDKKFELELSTGIGRILFYITEKILLDNYDRKFNLIINGEYENSISASINKRISKLRLRNIFAIDRQFNKHPHLPPELTRMLSNVCVGENKYNVT